MRTVVAIDPGTTHTGVVCMDERRVVDVKTIAFKQALMRSNRELVERSARVWEQVEDFLLTHPHDAVVIEGYVRYPGIKRVAASTMHQTPWLCGVLMDHLRASGENFAIQLSGDVLREQARDSMYPVLTALKARRSVYGDSEKLTNDHLRTAFCHGLYYLNHCE